MTDDDDAHDDNHDLQEAERQPPRPVDLPVQNSRPPLQTQSNNVPGPVAASASTGKPTALPTSPLATKRPPAGPIQPQPEPKACGNPLSVCCCGVLCACVAVVGCKHSRQ